MSEADKMFEELGYKMDNSDDIYYTKESIINEIKGLYYRESIIFCIKQKVVKYRNNRVRNMGLIFSIQELQAINKKCKELEWI